MTTRLLPLLLAVAADAAAIELPAGFSVETLPWTFDVPTQLAFLPDGRLLVAEKGGIVYVVAGTTRHPLWVREDEVLNTDDRGLLGLAVDPDYAVNRRLYFLYNCDPDSNGIELDDYDESFGRLTRYEVSATDSNAVDESTRTILIGASWSEGIPSASGAHNIADLAFGRDGTLLVAAGDGAHFDDVDAGGRDPNQFLPGRTDPAQDLGAFRAQSLNSLCGKVLRIDPETGHGLPSNPFWDGDPRSPRSRVWAYGFRNPFRIAVRPGTGSTDVAAGDPGEIYVADVGWSTSEELNRLTTGGGNYGWPCFEGPAPQPDYQAAAPAAAGCGTIGTPSHPSPATPPAVHFARSDPAASRPPGATGGTIIGGAFAGGAPWPANYRGLYFFADYVWGWLKALDMDGAAGGPHLIHVGRGLEGPVSVVADPVSGDLWVVAVWTGQVHRIRFAPAAAVEPPLPPRLALGAPVPNPTRGGITLSLDLPRSAQVEVRVYDAAGRLVFTETTPALPAGRHTAGWTGRTRSGESAAPGLYLVTVAAAGQSLTRRVARLD